MIELYGISSANVLKVLMMLEELELPYILHRAVSAQMHRLVRAGG